MELNMVSALVFSVVEILVRGVVLVVGIDSSGKRRGGHD